MLRFFCIFSITFAFAFSKDNLEKTNKFSEIDKHVLKEKYNIVALGNTGVGKSALLNMLAGEDAFVVGESAESQTQDTKSKLFDFLGKKNSIKLNLVDTQGLSDTGGDKVDMEHIIDMVSHIRELEDIDLFLICLDGTNPRLSSNIQATINLFAQIFPNFLSHSVLVFNKWSMPDQSKKDLLKENYQNIFETKYKTKNFPCFFIDSFYKRKMLRYNDDGTATDREPHPNIQAKTEIEVYALVAYLILKNSTCDVRDIKPTATQFSDISKERDELKKLFETKVVEYYKLKYMHKEAVEKYVKYEKEMDILKLELESAKSNKIFNRLFEMIQMLSGFFLGKFF